MDNKVSLERLISYVLDISQVGDNYTESEEEEKEDLNLNKEDLCPGEMSTLEIFPEKLKALIGPYTEDYYRIGVIKEKKDKRETRNISLYYSIVFCIDKQFIDFTENEKYIYLERMTGMLKLNLNEIFEVYKVHDDVEKFRASKFHKVNKVTKVTRDNEYKNLGWTKKKILEEIDNYTNSNIIIKLLSDYLNINVIVLNWDNDIISMCYTEEQYNRYKPSIIIFLIIIFLIIIFFIPI